MCFLYFYHLSSRNPAESVDVKECGHFSAEVVFNGLEIKVSATQHWEDKRIAVNYKRLREDVRKNREIRFFCNVFSF